MKFEKSIVQILSPYGEWPHKLGMQLVDERSLEKMKRAARFSTLVGCGIPIFIGHPDESPRSKAVPVGKISRIFGLGDGIAVEAKYSDEAFRKISEGKLKSMSPRWRMEKLPDGKFRPVKLISAGLTNNPNIPDSGRIVKSREDAATKARCSAKIKEIKKTVAAAHAARKGFAPKLPRPSRLPPAQNLPQRTCRACLKTLGGTRRAISEKLFRYTETIRFHNP